MLAMHLYCADNEDYMPHPTWGSNGAGADGWAYGTKLMSRFRSAQATRLLRLDYLALQAPDPQIPLTTRGECR
jgi:hypothetical protein